MLEIDSDCECTSVTIPQDGPSSSTPKRSPPLPSVVKKEKEDETPLPDPFPFPSHFRPDVEVGLKTGNMSREAKAAFYSSVASAMFSFKNIQQETSTLELRVR